MKTINKKNLKNFRIYQRSDKILEIGVEQYVPKIQRLSSEDCIIAYFSRKNSFHVLYDYPGLGAYERRLTSSFVEGPYARQITESDNHYEDSRESIALAIPIRHLPIEFEEFKLLRYSTAVDDRCMSFLSQFQNKIPFEKILDAANDISKNMRKLGLAYDEHEDNGLVYNEGYLLQFTLKEKYSHPCIDFIALGQGDTLNELTQRLRIFAIEKLYPSYLQDIAIRKSYSNGLLYNISLDQASKKYKKIEEILKLPNIIL